MPNQKSRLFCILTAILTWTMVSPVFAQGHKEFRMKVRPITAPYPRLWLNGDRLNQIQELIQIENEPWTSAYNIQRSTAQKGMKEIPSPYNGVVAEEFVKHVVRDGELALALAICGYIEDNAAYTEKAMEYVRQWVQQVPEPGRNFEKKTLPNHGLRLAMSAPLLEAYDITLASGKWSAAEKEAAAKWLRIIGEGGKHSLKVWATPYEFDEDAGHHVVSDDPKMHYFGNQVYQNHLSADLVNIARVALILGDEKLLQFAVDHPDNERDFCDMIQYAILREGDETFIFDHCQRKPGHKRYEGYIRIKERVKERANPQNGEIYDRYRILGQKGLTYAFMHSYLLGRMADLLAPHGLDFFEYTAPTGENLKQVYDFYAPFLLTGDIRVYGGFYETPGDRTRLETYMLPNWSSMFEIPAKHYPKTKEYRAILSRIDRATPYDGLILLRHGDIPKPTERRVAFLENFNQKPATEAEEATIQWGPAQAVYPAYLEAHQPQDLISEENQGVGGTGGDRCFLNQLESVENYQMGGKVHYFKRSVSPLQSLSLTGWFFVPNDAPEVPGGARYVQMQGQDVLVLMRVEKDMMRLSCAGLQAQSDYSFDTRGEWVFFAVTMEWGNEVEVTFYRGTKTEPVKPVSRKKTTGETKRWGGLGSYGNIAIGNVSGKGGSRKRFNRPFPGSLDSIRLIGAVQGNAGALSQESLEKIRQADIQNELPEL